MNGGTRIKKKGGNSHFFPFLKSLVNIRDNKRAICYSLHLIKHRTGVI